MGKKSDWLAAAQSKDKNVKPCSKCKGTGDSGDRNAKGETIVCADCGGFGY
jgi:hypothetical protein